MEIIRCEKGHFYDAELNSSCPQCAAEAAARNQNSSSVDPIGATEAVAGETMQGNFVGSGGSYTPSDNAFYTPFGAVEPIAETMPVTQPGFNMDDFTSQTSKVDSYGPTLPNYHRLGFNPIVGWLVCIDGPNKGQDYRIHAGYNYIGRAQSMDICIQNDQYISHQNAAVIGYDDLEHTFSFSAAGGHNTVRVNGKMVLNAVHINIYDELTIGNTKLLFIPLCGERFNWNVKP